MSPNGKIFVKLAFIDCAVCVLLEGFIWKAGGVGSYWVGYVTWGFLWPLRRDLIKRPAADGGPNSGLVDSTYIGVAK
jgi:hypothetical protein